ncbi:MAG: AmmeMemoRadiSam system protein B, partial [Rhodospirillaceae bacterium]
MTTVRAPAVAGSFYPGDPEVLRRQVAELIESAAPIEPMPYKAIIAPHAGYVYSGPIAGTAYAAVRHLANVVRRIVLLGPAHRVGFQGIAIPQAEALATPLGTVSIDRAALTDLVGLEGVGFFDAGFAGEHSLEVHLPFLQHIFPEARVVPLLVGTVKPELVEAVLTRLWGGPETLIVISSDLSHYRSYATAGRLDQETAHAIEALEPQKLNGQAACGFLPASGLLLRALTLDLRATTLDLRNSGDTAGGRDQVVGYGAWGFEPALSARTAEAHRTILIKAARESLVHAATTGTMMRIDPLAFPLPLRAVRRTFVTLTRDGQLRGCIGSLTTVDPLVVDVVNNAFRAAMQDPRFGAITAAEVDSIAIDISILSHPCSIKFKGETELLEILRPGVDGLIIIDNHKQALFLPKVWDMLPEPVDFLAHLKQKAG